MPSDFRLHVLGDPALTGPGGPVKGRAAHKRRIALLAVLAVARGRPVGRERLIGLLWPELPTDHARHNLSESLYVLRRELGEDALVPAGGDVALDPAVLPSDVAEFEAALEAGELERAAAVYGGPLLDGFYVADAPEFERWVDGERDRLARGLGRALERLAEAAEAEGSAIRAVDWWRRLAALDPFSSRTALRLVRALDAAGERPSALRFAETHAVLLREELGVDPDPDLEAFVERLRTDEPLRAPAPPPPLARAAVPEPAPPAAMQSVPVPASTDEVVDAPARAEPGDSADAVDAGGSSARAPAEGDVMPAVSTASTSQLASPEGLARVVDAPGTPSRAPMRKPRRRSLAYAGALAGAVLGLVLALAPVLPGRTAGRPPEPRYDPSRIAVLYFEDQSPGGELRYLASGLTEMLIHELSQVQALDVVPRGGVRPYRGASVSLDSLAAALRVGSVVEGSLQRSGDSVWVTVDLVDANAGSQLESRVVGRPMGDVVALQRVLAEEVGRSLRRRLGVEVRLRQARAETESPQALAWVLRAEQARDDARRLAVESDSADAGSAARLLGRADSLLALAEGADPGWARPTVLRGWMAHQRSAAEPASARRAFSDSAVARAGRVLRRDPGNAAALELRGTVVLRAVLESVQGAPDDRRLDAAERDLRAAVAADPSLARAWGTLSLLLRYRGRFAESDLAARRALAEDAYLEEAPAILQRLFSGALARADYRTAREECERGRRQFPADWRFVECALTLLREDPSRPPDPALAWRLVGELERLDPPARARAEGRPYAPVYRRMVAASVSARAGDADSARAVLARARREVGANAELRLSLAYDEACVRLLLGEKGQARRLLDELVAARPELRSFIRRDPLFRELFTSAGPPSG
jgi:DNA-binding SARP family transcriptional activator/TolB-like protein